MRVCHLNTCPVGVATQDPELRKNFTGQAEHVVNFFRFIAGGSARVHGGARLPDDGRDDRPRRPAELPQGRRPLEGEGARFLRDPPSAGRARPTRRGAGFARRITGSPRRSTTSSSRDAQDALEHETPVSLDLPIRNVQPDRRHDARISGDHEGTAAEALPDDTISLKFTGSAGQSFGALRRRAGITLTLEGDANDYIGKGLSGGKIIAFPPRQVDVRGGREHPHRQRRALRRDRAARRTSAAWPAGASR